MYADIDKSAKGIFMKDTSAKDCLHLFDTDVAGRLSPGWQAGVLHQRTKAVEAGPMLTVECYPVWDTHSARVARDEARKDAHKRAQDRVHARNARRKLAQLVNANFGAGDLIVTCTYAPGENPEDEKQAQRDIVAYLRRVAYLRKKHGLPQMRYIYITESTSSPKCGIRYHHHVIMSGGVSQADVQAAWKKRFAGICNARLAQPTERHLSGFAQYLTMNKRGRSLEADGKNPQQRAMRRRWNPSKNLVDPVETVADKKISIRKAGRIAEAAADFGQMRVVFEKLYPGYDLLEVQVKQSPWAAGVYIYAELARKREGKAVKRRE